MRENLYPTNQMNILQTVFATNVRDVKQEAGMAMKKKSKKKTKKGY